MDIRVGFGFDVHQLDGDRDLFLGGVKLESDLGALGHSDADVLLHAICDAILGAAAKGDIGVHFPNTAEEFKDIDSKKLLLKSCEIVRQDGWEIGNIDATLVLEKPKILPYIAQMKETIAATMEMEPDRISIKATTNETMGFIGRREGLVAHAVALIKR
jgi:2-C-methyl-D-erythritol 2,4-cyclodiphosphate synthase